ncbi:MAG: DUF4241 domain-containing protein [Candidatus Kapaibacteriales bacterium]
MLSHADYNKLFDSDSIDGMPITVIDIGKLNVTTGQIVVCDPLVTFDLQSLNREVKIGEYPIKIYEVKTENSGERYAIAQLEINKERAEKWVLALRDGEDVNELTEEGDFFGFPVDAGLGGFFDIQAGEEYLKLQDDFLNSNPNGNFYDVFLDKEFKKNAKRQNDPNDYGNWVNYRLPNSNSNITMFQSGYGDGIYPAYWGIDKSGNITSLVIDFFVVLLPDHE